MYEVSILMVSFLLLFIIVSITHYAESFDLKTDNTIVGGTIVGNEVVTGGLTANNLVAKNGVILENGDLVVPGKIILGTGDSKWTINPSMRDNWLNFYKEGNGPNTNNHGRIIMQGDGNIWQEVGGGWGSELNTKNSLNTQNLHSSNSTKFGPNGTTFKTILSNRNYMAGWPDNNSSERYIGFGFSFTNPPVVTISLMTNRSDYAFSAALKHVDTNGFWYKVWAINGAYPPNSFPAGDPHYLNWTAIGT